MSHTRNLDYLNKRRIIYRRSPLNDQPSEVFDWGDTTKMVHTNATNCFEVKLK